MLKLTVLVLIAAIATPGSYALAGASNPMSPSYNATNYGKTMTGKADVRKMQQKDMKASKQKHM